MGLLRLARETLEVPPEASVTAAVRMMTERRVGALAVISGPKVVGIFTERDLMRRVVYARLNADHTTVQEVMTSPVRSVHDSTSVAEAAAMMRAYHIRHLLVVGGDGAPLGMIGLRYLLYDVMDDLERKVGNLESFIMADGPGG